MRLKSTHASVANQRIKRTCVGNIFILCLLSSQVWSYANIKNHRFVRQLNAETETKTAVNYEDIAMTGSYHQPHFTENRAVVVQLFEWKFVDVAEECRNFLGPQGYAGVQLSPVLEHTVIKSSELNHPWWERYEVMSYRLASRSGDESEFWSMSRICNEQGVRIYADVILNHMAAPLHLVGAAAAAENEDFIVNTLLDTNVNISQFNYPNVSYRQQDFHRPSCMVSANAQDAYEIRNCQLNGHPDLDHSRDNVQKNIVEMLNKFVDMGVAGFRIDTAKHMWPIDLKNILKQVKNLSTEFNFKKDSRPFIYHDVFDLGLDTVSKTEYSTYGVVSEYLYPAELATILSGKVPLSSLINWGPAVGFLSHEDALVFIDSHDTQRGLPLALGHNHMLTYKKRIKYIMANVFMLVHPYGAIKRIMSSYYFPDTNINQGPPVEEADAEEIRSPKFNERKQCTKESGWVCEHRWPELVRMLQVVNYFKVAENKEESVIYFQTNGPNQVTFCRGYKAFVAINNDPENDFVKEVYACLEPGVYCDVVTGGKMEGKEECHGKMLEINAEGYMKLELVVANDSSVDDEGEEESVRIDSYGIIVIYVESKIQPKEGQLPTIENDGQAKEQEKSAEANENQTELNAAEITSKESQNSNEDTEVDENEEQEINDNDNSDQKDEANNEVMGNPNEIKEDISSEQPKEKEAETSLEQAGEEGGEGEKSVSSENNLEETDDKSVEENLEESNENASVSEKEEDSEDHDPADEANENDAEDLAERSIEDVQPAKNIEENENVEKNVEEQQENSSNEQEEQEPQQNEEPEVLTEINSAEIKTENIVADAETNHETVKEEVKNQSRNLDKRNIEAEEQIEKPSAETVDDTDVSDAVTAKIQDVQTAGIFSNPKGDGNNG